MHLSAGLTPGTYGGIARGLLTFVTNFWPETGALDCFCTRRGKIDGERPEGFETSRPS